MANIDYHHSYPSAPPTEARPRPHPPPDPEHIHHMPWISHYFVGPLSYEHHSRWPMFIRLHGSITPHMILPLLFFGGWTTMITCLHKYVVKLGVNQLLLTVLGFVVGLALSFRTSTAYERYHEGRKYWSQLTLGCQNLARLIWIFADEREGDIGREDLLAKITCMNLIAALPFALKHRLRWEPFGHYEDLEPYIRHLDTYAKYCDVPDWHKEPSYLKKTGMFLGIPMANSNPRRDFKHARQPVGNLPLEIVSYIASFLKTISEAGNETLKLTPCLTQALNTLAVFNDVITGTDRILNTPLPIAYAIAISQITWVYILLLPFQLVHALGWVTIPASIFAAYIILGIAFIGGEVENPFGEDTNDLPLDSFCKQIQKDIDTIMSRPRPRSKEYVKSAENIVLFPLSMQGYEFWVGRDVKEIRDALKEKPNLAFRSEKRAKTFLEKNMQAAV